MNSLAEAAAKPDIAEHSRKARLRRNCGYLLVAFLIGHFGILLPFFSNHLSAKGTLSLTQALICNIPAYFCLFLFCRDITSFKRFFSDCLLITAIFSLFTFAMFLTHQPGYLQPHSYFLLFLIVPVFLYLDTMVRMILLLGLFHLVALIKRKFQKNV